MSRSAGARSDAITDSGSATATSESFCRTKVSSLPDRPARTGGSDSAPYLHGEISIGESAGLLVIPYEMCLDKRLRTGYGELWVIVETCWRLPVRNSERWRLETAGMFTIGVSREVILPEVIHINRLWIFGVVLWEHVGLGSQTLDQSVSTAHDNSLIEQAHLLTQRQVQQRKGLKARKRAGGVNGFSPRLTNLHRSFSPTSLPPGSSFLDLAGQGTVGGLQISPPELSGPLACELPAIRQTWEPSTILGISSGSNWSTP